MAVVDSTKLASVCSDLDDIRHALSEYLVISQEAPNCPVDTLGALLMSAVDRAVDNALSVFSEGSSNNE